MNIIVCGVDRSGKTTLTKRLKRDLGFARVHFTCPKENLHEDDYVLVPDVPVFNQIMEYDQQHESQNMIYDRFIYSDIVYGPIYRKPDTIGFRKAEQTFAEMKMQARGDVVVYAKVQDFDQNYSSVTEENEGILDAALLKDVRSKYDSLMDHVNSLCPVIAYDWHMPNSYENALKAINANINAYDDAYRQFAVAGINLLDYYVGPFVNKPSRVVVINHGHGKMSYDDFIYACMQDPTVVNDPTVGILKLVDDIVDAGCIKTIFKEYI